MDTCPPSHGLLLSELIQCWAMENKEIRWQMTSQVIVTLEPPKLLTPRFVWYIDRRRDKLNRFSANFGDNVNVCGAT